MKKVDLQKLYGGEKEMHLLFLVRRSHEKSKFCSLFTKHYV